MFKEDPVSIGRLYQIIITTEKGGLSRRFRLIFENDPVNCNGNKYLADVIKSSINKYSNNESKKRDDGELFKTRMPKDGVRR